MQRGKSEFGLEELPRGERRDTVLRVGGHEGRHAIVLSRGIRGVWARRAAAGRVPGDCSAWGDRGVKVFLAGARGFRARRDAAGRAPGDCSACGEAPGDCSERGQRKFGLNEFPQGECREIVLRGGRKAGGQEIVLGGRMGSSGSKSCRRASAGRLFCVGEWGGGGILFWVGEGGVRARRISAGRASGDCSAWRMGGWGAAGDWSEREKGEFGLGDLPQGERRDIVLRGGAEEGEAA